MQSLEEGGNSAARLRSHGARSAPYKARQADPSAAQAGVCAHLLPIHACVTGYSTEAMSAQTASPPEYRLYKLTPLWGLPSASPACVRVEVSICSLLLPTLAHVFNSELRPSFLMQAYLRLAGVNAAAEECVNSSTSPSGIYQPPLVILTHCKTHVATQRCGKLHAHAGQLPALEHEVELVETAGDGSNAARAIIRYLKEHGHDLDAGLNASQVLQHTALATTCAPAVYCSVYRRMHMLSSHAHTGGCKFADLPATQCDLLPTPQSIPHRVGMQWSEAAGTACDMSRLRTCSWSCREQT